uniref:Uncharacterized protein n=1 Tax=viral metagenome TaxID=1070528 RepID=A0A6M3K5C9_9ZZZZ
MAETQEHIKMSDQTIQNKSDIKYPEEIKADGISRTIKLSESGKLATLKTTLKTTPNSNQDEPNHNLNAGLS